MFDGTIKENIAYPETEYDDDKIINAATLANQKVY